jgi:pyridoxamine 5'-phosphate oxidase
MNLESFRREYLSGGLERENLNDDPIVQFSLWMQQAVDSEIQDSTVMIVASVAANGQPSQRIVLLKKIDQNGFVFFTNYESRKASELSTNSKISLLFPWNIIDRQVKVCGDVEKITVEQSSEYFFSRPKGSQLAAIASKQSSVLTSRKELVERFESLQKEYEDKNIPLPGFWGGYRVIPSEIEFWQGGANRLHDRFRYLRNEGGWVIDRLAP